MKYYLYTFNFELELDNWADGFAILTEIQKDMALAKIKKDFKHGGTITIATNEDYRDYESLEDVLESAKFKEISYSEYQTLKKLFPHGYVGEVGPLNKTILDNEEYEYEELEELEECENCGGTLVDGECGDCEQQEEEDRWEEEYQSHANKISDFIEKEYGIEESLTRDYHSLFKWKPTPKTEIEISISEFNDGDEEVELTLKLNETDLEYEFFLVEDIYENPGAKLKKVIKGFIEKAKKY